MHNLEENVAHKGIDMTQFWHFTLIFASLSAFACQFFSRFINKKKNLENAKTDSKSKKKTTQKFA